MWAITGVYIDQQKTKIHNNTILERTENEELYNDPDIAKIIKSDSEINA